MHVVLRPNVDDRKKSILAHPLAGHDISNQPVGGCCIDLLNPPRQLGMCITSELPVIRG
jgi:hypothetical protein